MDENTKMPLRYTVLSIVDLKIFDATMHSMLFYVRESVARRFNFIISSLLYALFG